MFKNHEKNHSAALSYVSLTTDPERVIEKFEAPQEYEDECFWVVLICWSLTALAVVVLAV